MSEWLIVARNLQFEIAAASDADPDDYVVARHPNEASAIEGVERAQALEKQLRPMWQAAIEHELRLRNTMLSAVHETARAPKPIHEGEEE